MKNFFNNYIKENWWFYILTGISILLLIASFCVPPMGVIDSSVLLATSEIFAFAGLGTVIKAIDKGMKASVKKGDTEFSIGEDKEDKEDE